MGSFQALGECASLGFIRVFPADIVKGYASGTGIANILASAYFTLFHGVFELPYW